MASWSKDPETGMPNYVPEGKRDDVSLVTTSGAQEANNNVIGIVTPGWTYYTQHTRANGQIRRTSEVLVSFKRVADPEPEEPEEP